MAEGTLIPIGGNEDKGSEENEIYVCDCLEEGILSRIVNESGGPDALIVIIPTASSVPLEVIKGYLDAFTKLGCTNVKSLDIRTQRDAETSEALDLARTAQCIMFSGGDQSKISKKIGQTKFHAILAERYTHETGFVIAGTSAGAMMMSHHMIAGGSSKKAFVKDAVKMRAGLSLAPQIIVDTHFIHRGRFGRLAEAVAKFPNLIGIGLAEDTGLIIKNGNEMKVIGSGMVIVFDGGSLKHNNEKILKPGTPMTMVDLRVHVLSNSDIYHLKERTITALPIGSPFER
jgi:cyanophycinase